MLLSGCVNSEEELASSYFCEEISTKSLQFDEALRTKPFEQLPSMQQYKIYVEEMSVFFNQVSKENAIDQDVAISLNALENYLSEYILYEELQRKIIEMTFGNSSVSGWTPLYADAEYARKVQRLKYKILVGSAVVRISCQTGSQDDLELIKDFIS